MRKVSIALAGLAVALAPGAMACITPVYRYALERWMPLPYQVVVFHGGKAIESEDKQFVALRASLCASNANIEFRDVGVATPSTPEFQKLWESCQDKPLPWMVVCFPRNVAAEHPVWSVAFNAENIGRLLNSPARAHIARHLSAGDAAMWILVESGRKELDAAKTELFQKTLKKLSDEFTIASHDAAKSFQASQVAGYPAAAAAPVAADITFGFTRIARTDAAEAVLLRMFFEYARKNAEPEISEPRAFLVFGRGRTLGPLTGAEISEENITEATSFLSGPCLCEIKEQNPGVDLLMNVDWNDVLEHKPLPEPAAVRTTELSAPPVAGVPVPAASAPVARPPASQSGGSQEVSSASASNTGLILAIVMIGAGIVFVSLATVRKRSA